MKEKKEAYLDRLGRSPALRDGAVKTLELSCECTGKQKALRDAAVCVFAPVLHSFVLWLLREAMDAGTERLYFLPEGGWHMYAAAKRYAEYYSLPVECRYLYVSDYSLRMPLYHKDMEEALRYITLRGAEATLETVLKSASLSERQIRRLEQLDENFAMPFPMKMRIPGTLTESLRKKLSENKDFLEMVRENSEKAYADLEIYLRQEGIMDEIPMAVVCGGQEGAVQGLLERIRRTGGGRKPLDGYYFGLYEWPAGADRKRYHTYFFSPQRKPLRKVFFNHCLFGGIYSAPYGMAMTYRESGGKWVPILKNAEKGQRKRAEILGQYFREYQEELLRGTALQGEGGAGTGPDDFCRLCAAAGWRETDMLTEKLLFLFTGFPTGKEASVFGSMVYPEDRQGERMAAKMTERELKDNHLARHLFRDGREGEAVRKSAWYEGSAVLYGNPKKRRSHLASYHRYQYFLYRKERKCRGYRGRGR